jgi:hypothetical protein
MLDVTGFTQPLAAEIITFPTPPAPELYLDLMNNSLPRALIARQAERHAVRLSRGLTRLILNRLRAQEGHLLRKTRRIAAMASVLAVCHGQEGDNESDQTNLSAGGKTNIEGFS